MKAVIKKRKSRIQEQNRGLVVAWLMEAAKQPLVISVLQARSVETPKKQKRVHDNLVRQTCLLSFLSIIKPGNSLMVLKRVKAITIYFSRKPLLRLEARKGTFAQRL